MVSTPLDIAFERKPGDRRLYGWAALLALGVVFAGFARSYYLKGAFGTPELSPLQHAHGLAMTAWFLLFFVQVRLVASGRTALHRRLGAWGALIAVLVLVVGTATAIVAARHGATPGPPPLVFLAIPLGDMVVFLTLVVAALSYRRRPDFHKRLMLCASIGILTAAIARIPLDFLRAGGLPAFFGTTDLLLLAFIAYDTARNRRLHPAFAAGLLVVVGSQVARFLIAGTPQWDAFARWLIS
jgi:hypothetical protein